jgi:hypothetical protein
MQYAGKYRQLSAEGILPFKTDRSHNHIKPQHIKYFYLVYFIMCMAIQSSVSYIELL